MELTLTEREKEVLRLKNLEKMSYQAIADRYGICRGRAFQIYRDAERKSREAYRLEMCRVEYQKEVSLTLTKGELIRLCDILDDYDSLRFRNIRHGFKSLEELEHDPKLEEARRLRALLYQLYQNA